MVKKKAAGTKKTKSKTLIYSGALILVAILAVLVILSYFEKQAEEQPLPSPTIRGEEISEESAASGDIEEGEDWETLLIWKRNIKIPPKTEYTFENNVLKVHGFGKEIKIDNSWVRNLEDTSGIDFIKISEGKVSGTAFKVDDVIYTSEPGWFFGLTPPSIVEIKEDGYLIEGKSSFLFGSTAFFSRDFIGSTTKKGKNKVFLAKEETKEEEIMYEDYIIPGERLVANGNTKLSLRGDRWVSAEESILYFSLKNGRIELAKGEIDRMGDFFEINGPEVRVYGEGVLAETYPSPYPDKKPVILVEK